MQVVVRWDPHVVPHLKPEAVPGLTQTGMDSLFPGAFIEVTPLVAMPEEKKTHLPGCICCDGDELGQVSQ